MAESGNVGDPFAEFDKYFSAQKERDLDIKISKHEEKMNVREQMQRLRDDPEAGIHMFYYRDLEVATPEAYDLSGIEERNRADALKYIQVLKSYVDSPAMTDVFTNHRGERTPWKKGLPEDLLRVYRMNRLKFNRIVAVKDMMKLLAGVVSETDVRRGVLEIASDAITTNQKVEVEDLGRVDLMTTQVLMCLKLFEDRKGVSQENASGEASGK